MKSEFEFLFTATDFRFEKPQKIRANATPNAQGDDIPSNIELLFRIEPLSNDDDGPTQSGKLFVTTPLRPEAAEDLVYEAVHHLESQINFNNPGTFQVNFAFYMGELIPETAEERIEVGDKPHFGKAHFVEYIPEPAFQPEAFSHHASKRLDPVLVAQHNQASRSSNSAERLLGYFKIIEDIAAGPERRPAKSMLLGSKALRTAFFKVHSDAVTEDQYLDFVNKTVFARDSCAHLKRQAEFGYMPSDARFANEVEPLLPLMYVLTYQMICDMSEEGAADA